MVIKYGVKNVLNMPKKKLTSGLLPLDFRDYKTAQWLSNHPESLTYSIKHLYDNKAIQTTGDRPIQGGPSDNAIRGIVL